MKYRIEIQEVLARTVSIDANSIDEAFKQVRELYRKEEIVLTANDYIDTTCSYVRE